MNKRVPTILDVARAANVSTATVSRALSHPERVSEDARRLVAAAIERTGYRVNQTARNLRRKQTGAIVVLVPNLGNPFFSQILSGIETVAAKAGYNVLVADTRAPHADEGQLADYLSNNRADGLVILDGSLPRHFFSGARGPRPPIVFCCEWSEGSALPSVRFDNEGGAALGVAHLADLGHRAIGHILGPAGNVLTEERRRGVERALAERGLARRPDWFFPGDFSLASGALAARAWLDLGERPSAVTASSDEMACGFISELHRNGVAVPADISVVGFDDIEISERYIPALTTIHQPRIDIGVRAAAALIDLIREPETAGSAEGGPIPAELIVRSSTRAFTR